MTAKGVKQDKNVEQVPYITTDAKPLNNNLWVHFKILYFVVLLLGVGLSVSTWICLKQISKLRTDFEGEILPNGVVEFGEPHRYYGNTWEAREDEDGEDDNMTSHTGESITASLGDDVISTDHAEYHGYEVVEGEGRTQEEDLIRVKRRAPRSSKKSRKKKRDKPRAQDSPLYFDGNTPPHNQDGSEGSGAGQSMDDWVWLTSYSRIPVVALTQFCKASHDFCPPGQPGPAGLPGIRGITGLQGGIGERGDPGYNGPKGEPGEVGEKGETGYDGVMGLPGLKGEPGINADEGAEGPAGPPGLQGHRGFDGLPGDHGINGTQGRRGKRGKLGTAGPKGDTGPAGLEGPKGHRGTRGDIGTPGLDADTTNCTCPPGPYATGPPGLPGPSGLQGFKGQKGDPGSSNLVLDTTTIATTTATTPEPTEPPTTTPEPTIDPRNSDCRIRMVGKPLFQRYTGTYWGAWMKDTYRKTPPSVNKFWFTRHFTGKSLYEYANQDEFRANRETKVYDLADLYFGTGHTVYDGAFFYHKSGTRDLIKFDLDKSSVTGSVEIPNAAYHGKHYVYSTEYNYMDLASDENGLWVIYSAQSGDNSLLVSKINPYTMELEKTWSINVNHRNYGNGFITCGVLYLIKSTHSKTTLIDFAYDLYTKQKLPNVRLQFTNPFQMNNMISYNPLEGRIYSWDKGNQLTYPLLL